MSKKEILAAFDNFPICGPCKINRAKMEKAFDIDCRILCHFRGENDEPEYTFLHYTPKARRNLRATISKEDAEWIISRFLLREVQPYRGRSLAYVPCVIA